jgi:hypothetical protein
MIVPRVDEQCISACCDEVHKNPHDCARAAVYDEGNDSPIRIVYDDV